MFSVVVFVYLLYLALCAYFYVSILRISSSIFYVYDSPKPFENIFIRLSSYANKKTLPERARERETESVYLCWLIVFDSFIKRIQ